MHKRQQRVISLLLLFSLLLVIIAGRLALIQLLQGKRYAQEAVKQRAQLVVLNHNRGDILDRHGDSLLGGEKKKVLAIFPSLLNRCKSNIKDELMSAIPQAGAASAPFIALENLSSAEAEYFRKYHDSGLIVTTVYHRYGREALANHLVGHIGPDDGEGKVGLEKYFNNELQGYPHTLAAMMDGKKRLIKGLGFRFWQDEQKGAPSDLILTIDSRIQQQVEAVMDREIHQGAVVVMDPHTGHVLAMASRPNYYQADLSTILNNREKYKHYLDAKPFINRGLLSYPPASIFKIVVAAAAFEAGGYNLFHRFSCPGHIHIGDRTFHCSLGQPHGDLDLGEAFAQSCNTVFIQLALELGKDTLYAYAKKMGLGEKTGLLPGSAKFDEESSGLLPLPTEMAYLGELALMALGQGNLEATPLQLARLTAIVANGGYLVEPRLVIGLRDEGGRMSPFRTFSSPNNVISPLAANQLRYLMLKVVDQGTGKKAQSEKMIIGGKTGTAETGQKDFRGNPQYYSWFSGIMPLQDSRAVITVFIEEPQGKSAAVVFKDIAETIEEFI